MLEVITVVIAAGSVIVQILALTQNRKRRKVRKNRKPKHRR